MWSASDQQHGELGRSSTSFVVSACRASADKLGFVDRELLLVGYEDVHALAACFERLGIHPVRLDDVLHDLVPHDVAGVQMRERDARRSSCEDLFDHDEPGARAWSGGPPA